MQAFLVFLELKEGQEPLDQQALGVNQDNEVKVHLFSTSVPLTMEGALRDAKTLLIPTSVTAMKDIRLKKGSMNVQVYSCFFNSNNKFIIDALDFVSINQYCIQYMYIVQCFNHDFVQ